jgi:hypothetical protein
MKRPRPDLARLHSLARCGAVQLPFRWYHRGEAFRFFLGTHHTHWLAKAGVPLFVSRRRLLRLRTLPRALAPWALDSGAFSELAMHGAWTVGPREYAADVRRYGDEIGLLAWAAPQDWMCEPGMLGRTGLTVDEHQRRTVANFLELRTLDAPVIPVLQGWTSADYLRHVDAYDRAGVDLRGTLVGVGTICRRQRSRDASAILLDVELSFDEAGTLTMTIRDMPPSAPKGSSVVGG